jgi:hypothetical protein
MVHGFCCSNAQRSHYHIAEECTPHCALHANGHGLRALFRSPNCERKSPDPHYCRTNGVAAALLPVANDPTSFFNVHKRPRFQFASPVFAFRPMR